MPRHEPEVEAANANVNDKSLHPASRIYIAGRKDTIIAYLKLAEMEHISTHEVFEVLVKCFASEATPLIARDSTGNIDRDKLDAIFGIVRNLMLHSVQSLDAFRSGRAS